jgi:hypothetical protein
VTRIGVETTAHTTQESVLDHVSTVQDQKLGNASNVTSTPDGCQPRHRVVLSANVMPTGLVLTVPSGMRLVTIVVRDVAATPISTVLNV